MYDIFTPASILVLHERLNDLGPLLRASQSHVRTILFNFWDSLDTAETIHVSWYKNAGSISTR